jgi:hypothetical protein
VRVFHQQGKANVLQPIFLKLFTVSDAALTLAVVQCLPEIAPVLLPRSKVPVSEPEQAFRAAVLARVKELWLQHKKSPWRQQLDLIRALPAFRFAYPLGEYSEYFFEEMLNILKTGNLQTKHAACTTCCALILGNPHQGKREEWIKKLTTLGQSPSYYDRISYMSFCIAAVGSMSLDLVRRCQILEPVLVLASDKVANVRLRFIKAALKMLPRAHPNVQNALVDKLKLLQSDKDREVRRLSLKMVAQVQGIVEENAKFEDDIAEANDRRYDQEQELAQGPAKAMLERVWHRINLNA